MLPSLSEGSCINDVMIDCVTACVCLCLTFVLFLKKPNLEKKRFWHKRVQAFEKDFKTIRRVSLQSTYKSKSGHSTANEIKIESFFSAESFFYLSESVEFVACNPHTMRMFKTIRIMTSPDDNHISSTTMWTSSIFIRLEFFTFQTLVLKGCSAPNIRHKSAFQLLRQTSKFSGKTGLSSSFASPAGVL